MHKKQWPGTRVKKFVKMRLSQFEHSKNEAAVRADLARLRRGAGKSPLEAPEVWSLTLFGLDDDLLCKEGEPSKAEWAVHIAMTLYAIHQQSSDISTANMNCEGEEYNLGRSLGRMIVDTPTEERITRRFNIMATSENLSELSVHLRGLIQLMRAHTPPIPLDYARLAEELYYYQMSKYTQRIRMSWGQNFYSRTPIEKQNSEEKSGGNNE